MDLPVLGGLLPAYHIETPALAGVVLVTVTLLGAYIFWLGYPRPLRGIPYNKDSARKWLGDVPSFQKHFAATGEGWDWMALQCQKLNSPIVQVFLGPYQKPAVILVDQLEIRDITTRRLEDFDRGGFLTRWLSVAVPHGTIAMPTHSRFKAQRAVWQGTMSGEFVNRVFAPQISKHATSLVNRWTAKAEVAQGKPFEFNRDIRAAVFEIVWAAAFGEDLNLMNKQSPQYLAANVRLADDEAVFPDQKDEGILQAIAYLLDILEITRVSAFPVLHHFILRQGPEYRRFDAIKKKTIKGLLADSKKKFESVKDDESQVKSAMDFVYKRQQDKAGKIAAASDAEMEDELMVLLVGGFESSSWNMSWGLKHLSQNPAAQASLHEELSAVFPGANNKKLPSAREITTAQLPYVDACIEETLRLARTNAGALRIAIRDTQIYDYFIPKGTDFFGVHSGESAVIELPPRPADWKSGPRVGAKNAQWEHGTLSDFRPERWLKKSESGNWVFESNAGPFMAFGTGLRGCFGQRLARTTMRILIVSLFLSFDFERVNGHKASFAAEEKLVRMAKSCYVNLKVRA